MEKRRPRLNGAPGRSTNNRLTWSECEKNATYLRSCSLVCSSTHCLPIAVSVSRSPSLSLIPSFILDNFNSWWWIVAADRTDRSISNYKSYKQRTTGCCLRQKRNLLTVASPENKLILQPLTAADLRLARATRRRRLGSSLSSSLWTSSFSICLAACLMMMLPGLGAWSVNDLWCDVASRCLISEVVVVVRAMWTRCAYLAPSV